MRLLLLLGLLTAGSTSHIISRRSLMQMNTMIQCTTSCHGVFWKYSNYGCNCGFRRAGVPVDELDRCCQTHHQCYDQVKNLDYCTSPIDSPYTSTYSYSCSGNIVTCSDKNNPCQTFICECDRQLAICISKAPYHKEYKFIHC